MSKEFSNLPHHLHEVIAAHLNVRDRAKLKAVRKDMDILPPVLSSDAIEQLLKQDLNDFFQHHRDLTYTIYEGRSGARTLITQKNILARQSLISCLFRECQRTLKFEGDKTVFEIDVMLKETRTHLFKVCYERAPSSDTLQYLKFELANGVVATFIKKAIYRHIKDDQPVFSKYITAVHVPSTVKISPWFLLSLLYYTTSWVRKLTKEQPFAASIHSGKSTQLTKHYRQMFRKLSPLLDGIATALGFEKHIIPQSVEHSDSITFCASNTRTLKLFMIDRKEWDSIQMNPIV